MSFHKRILLLIFSLCLPVIIQATEITDRAKNLIDKGEYKQAAMLLRPEAEAGEPEAAILAAQLFFDGKGVIKSAAQGYKYLQLAADNGSADAVSFIAQKRDEEGNVKAAVDALEKFRQAYPENFKDDASTLPVLLGKYYRDRYNSLGIGRKEATAKAWDIVRLTYSGMNDIRVSPRPWIESLMDLHGTDLSGLAEYFMQQTDFLMANDVLIPYVMDQEKNPNALGLEELRRMSDKGDPLATVAIADWYFNNDSQPQAIKACRQLFKNPALKQGHYIDFWKRVYNQYYLPGDTIGDYFVFKVDPSGKIPMVATLSQPFWKITDFQKNHPEWRMPTADELKTLESIARNSNYQAHMFATKYPTTATSKNNTEYTCLVTEIADGPVFYNIRHPGASPIINVKSIVNSGSYTKVQLQYWWNARYPRPDNTPFNQNALLRCNRKDYPLYQWSYTTKPQHLEGAYYTADLTLYFERIPDDWTNFSINMPGCWDIPNVSRY